MMFETLDKSEAVTCDNHEHRLCETVNVALPSEKKSVSVYL